MSELTTNKLQHEALMLRQQVGFASFAAAKPSFAAAKPSFAPTKPSFAPAKPSFAATKQKPSGRKLRLIRSKTIAMRYFITVVRAFCLRL
ncbi:hypothetical protein [Alloprevotella tannerae]|uniref:hypothetical protein n=1 Tax=Alloprevotella tannerae TaxID=76122 RepID=UPI0025E1965A|nr:hypothetical protein [Alloprevotella tannerae]